MGSTNGRQPLAWPVPDSSKVHLRPARLCNTKVSVVLPRRPLNAFNQQHGFRRYPRKAGTTEPDFLGPAGSRSLGSSSSRTDCPTGTTPPSSPIANAGMPLRTSVPSFWARACLFPSLRGNRFLASFRASCLRSSTDLANVHCMFRCWGSSGGENSSGPIPAGKSAPNDRTGKVTSSSETSSVGPDLMLPSRCPEEGEMSVPESVSERLCSQPNPR